MQVVQTTNLEDYIGRLQEDSDEVGALFRDLLIGVTDFFRDAEAFRALETLVIPTLFEGKGPDDEVRVWVAGCATGEEVYFIAILLREHMDSLAALPRVQIFATDIDDTAMTVARTARYPKTLVNEVSPERLKRFFVQEGASYRVTKDLREMCIFSNHSLIRDPPFSRLDLVSCRNLLIYLKPGLQGQVLSVVPLCSPARRLSLPRAFREYCTIYGPVSSARQDEPCLPTPRSGRAIPSSVPAVPPAHWSKRYHLGR